MPNINQIDVNAVNDRTKVMSIKDFTIIEEPNRIPYIPWSELEKMPPEMCRVWKEKSMGSTCSIEGVYRDDLAKFLRLYNKGL